MRTRAHARHVEHGPKSVTVVVDGLTLTTVEGRSLTAMLHQAGIIAFHRNLVTDEVRGPFCGMGICFECEVIVEGLGDVRACMTEVREGLIVETDLVGRRSGK